MTSEIWIHRTGVVKMSFPSGARVAVALPSVPPQRLIRNDCSLTGYAISGLYSEPAAQDRQGGSSARFRAHKIVYSATTDRLIGVSSYDPRKTRGQ